VSKVGGLQVDQQHRRAAALRHRQQHRRRHVRRQEPDDQVAARRAQLLRGDRALRGVGDEPDVHDVDVADLAQALRHPRRGALQLREQVGELRPVGAQPAGHQPDGGAARRHPLQCGRALEQGRHRSSLSGC
jgi:hypothetical protein